MEKTNKPMKLAKGCRCPVCGFKTMATKCRQCGQLLEDDEIRPYRTSYDLVDKDGKVLFTGNISEMSRHLSTNKHNVYWLLKSGNTIHDGWRVVKSK